MVDRGLDPQDGFRAAIQRDRNARARRVVLGDNLTILRPLFDRICSWPVDAADLFGTYLFDVRDDALLWET